MTDPCPACGPEFVRWLNADPARQTAWLALPRRRVDAGQALQSVGQSLSGVWFVEKGLLRSYFLNTTGLERNCAFHAEWEWAGMPPPRGAPVLAAFAIDALELSQVVELSHAGLISSERDGRHLVYRAEFASMNDLLAYLTAHCCQGRAGPGAASTGQTSACAHRARRRCGRACRW